jgi:hypothetical protein
VASIFRVPSRRLQSGYDSFLKRVSEIESLIMDKVNKVKFSLYRPWSPLGLREVKVPTFSDIRVIDGGKSLAVRAGRFLPPGKFLVLISVRG